MLVTLPFDEEIPRPREAGPPPRGDLIIYVDDDAPDGGDGLSWGTAFRFLQDGLAAAEADPEVAAIRVGEGVYRPDQGANQVPGAVEVHFSIPAGVSVAGGFAGFGAPDPDERNVRLYESVLSGDLNGDDLPDSGNREDNSWMVAAVLEEGSLDGVTISGGFFRNSLPPPGSGAVVPGLDFRGGAALRGCTFRDNRSDRSTASGALLVGTQRVEACRFINNRASHYGGAVRTPLNPSNTLPIHFVGCQFLGNRAVVGGAVFTNIQIGSPQTTAIFENCVFSGNTAEDETRWNNGGAITGTNVILRNCTLANNHSPLGDGGAVTNANRSMRFENCILWGNEDDSGVGFRAQYAGLTESENEPTVFVNCVVRGWNAEIQQRYPDSIGTIDADPGFIDPLGADGAAGTEDDNLRLAAFSPAIDAGDDTNVLERLDADGLPRFFDDPTIPDGPSGFVDMGAYEYQYDCDGNGTLDSIDITASPAIDCDSDGVIDSCQPLADCNSNGTNDRCEIAAGDGMDCNANGVPDSCDITSGYSLDADADGVPDECQFAVLYVKDDAPGADDGSSWSDAFRDLQDALDAAASRFARTEIWVARGTYLPDRGTGLRKSTFQVREGASLYGGFSGSETAMDQRDWNRNETVLSGDLAGDDGSVGTAENAYHVVTVVGASSDDEIDGFTIRAGHALAPVGPILYTYCICGPHDFGAAISISGGSPIIRNCLITENAAIDRGGAVYSTGEADMTIQASTLTGNRLEDSSYTIPHYGGFAVFNDARLSLAGSRVEAHGDSGVDTGGGAVYNDGAMHISDSHFQDNHSTGYGGAILSSSVPFKIVNSRFLENSAGSAGGGVYLGTRGAIVANCLFAGNSAARGAGGGQSYPTQPLFGNAWVNCTFVANTSASDAAGLWSVRSWDVIASNILWANAEAGVADYAAQIAGSKNNVFGVFANNTIMGLDADDGHANNALDPLFRDPLGPDGLPATGDEDYRLSPFSPAIDSASNLHLPPDTFDLDNDGDTDEPIPLDLDGNPRFQNDPFSPDTGEPGFGLPIVDRGPYEFIPICHGDLDGDNTVGMTDLNILLSDFGCVGDPPRPRSSGGCPGDADHDGDTDSTDLNLVLSLFGFDCG